jgi:protocatechuate 3,4-dioxygenase beta subunit
MFACSRSALALQLALVLIAATLHAQTPQPGGVIIGRVVDIDSGEPVPGARVAIVDSAGGRTMTGGSDSYEVLTDSQGRFFFSALRPGLRSISTRTTEGNIINRASQPVLVQLEANQVVRDVVVAMTRSAWISGRVTDEAGDPVVGTYVSAYIRTGQESQPAMVAMRSSVTDDRGDYLLDPLIPGEYLVCACQWVAPVIDPGMAQTLRMLQPAPREADIPVEVDARWRPPVRTFYPSAGHPEHASVVTLRSNEGRSDVHIGVISSRLSAISGRVTGLSDAVPRSAIRLQPVMPQGSPVIAGFEPFQVTPDNGFRFTDIPPGNYLLLVRYRGPESSTSQQNGLSRRIGYGLSNVRPSTLNDISLWNATAVTVDGRDITDLHVAVSPALSISGVVRFLDKGIAEPLRANGGALERLDEPVDLAVTSPVRADDDGRFVLEGVVPGRYRFHWTILPPGLTLHSVRFGGREVTDLPFVIEEDSNPTFEVTLVNDASGTVSGRVFSSTGAPPAAVAAFPADRRFWEEPHVATRRFIHASADQLGRFTLEDVPPGEYIVAPIGAGEARGAWRTLPKLEALSVSGHRVTVVAGENPVLEIRR